MRAKKIVTMLSMGALVGSIMGFVASYRDIIANKYIQYKMCRLIALGIQKYLNKWVILLMLIFILLALVLLTIKKFIYKFPLANIIEIRIKDKKGLKSILALMFCFAFFFCVGWAFNYYWQPYWFQPTSLLGDVGILLLSIFLGWILIKGRWENIFRFIKRTASVLVLSLLILNLSILIDSRINVPKGPNVVLISVDSLRPDHLGCYGYKKATSPNVDKFAKDCILFENCFSHSSHTRPSCGSLLSGFLPHETKLLRSRPLPLAINTIAEFLKNKGYTTIAAVSNYVLRRGRGFEQGFNLYDDTMDEEELVRHLPERTAEKTTDCVIKFLKNYCNHKFFIWIHYQDPHGPYTPPSPFNNLFKNHGKKPLYLKFNDTLSGNGGIPSYQRLGEHKNFNYYVSQYDGEIRYFDECFKRLIDTLKELNIYKDSLIIFTSDHGEGMGEHNYFFAHNMYLYHSLIHVPLIVKYGKKSPGRSREYIQHIDIIPTILKAVGIDTDFYFRGQDLLSNNSNGKEIFSAVDATIKEHPNYSIIIDGVKLMYSALENKYHLFDLKKDPREEINLIAEVNYKERAEHVNKRLRYIASENLLRFNIITKDPKITHEEEQKLKSLGYVQ